MDSNETSVMSNSKRWVPAVPYFCSLDNSSIQFTSGFWHQLPKVSASTVLTSDGNAQHSWLLKS
ncbi:Protein of unknown function [Pyronema omphalodes CBS 100304]|uniref:Uncharacterized protein n=1 Tax=Pyronema omphalodes (strain CBS 100304) TaxID=1076935 RepID=U4LVF4_PYROM|nr:Protein of unknown function [Pyronema omphalodes CBS 100304]